MAWLVVVRWFVYGVATTLAMQWFGDGRGRLCLAWATAMQIINPFARPQEHTFNVTDGVDDDDGVRDFSKHTHT